MGINRHSPVHTYLHDMQHLSCQFSHYLSYFQRQCWRLQFFYFSGTFKTSGIDPDNPTLGEVTIAGAGAGVGVSFVLTPVELVKIRMQTGQYRGTIECIRESFLREGPGVFFKGWTSTLLREIPGSAAWFGCYEAYVHHMTPTGEEPSPSTIIVGGGLGGMGYWTAFYPADSVKTVLQSSENKGSFSGTFMRLLRQGGIRKLYRGLTPTLMRALPANAAVFYVYEVLRSSLA